MQHWPTWEGQRDLARSQLVTTVDVDHRVRLAAFRFLEDCTVRFGEAVPRQVLAQGFTFEGRRVPLASPQGIFKPAVLPEIPLSITTVPIVEGKVRPYDDEMSPDGYLAYRYRGTDPQHRDNVGLRKAMLRRVPLVYLYGLVKGWYRPVWPVFIVGDDPRKLSFTVAVDDATVQGEGVAGASDGAEVGRRRYITAATQVRLHQSAFRMRVLRAYKQSCAICRLKHPELLEAAHIIPDRDPRGEPTVTNGLSLCGLHHTALDRNVLGVRPDYHIDLRQDILEENDGPMLRYGLQEFQDKKISLPRRVEDRPNQDFLEERYERFREAG